MSSAQPLRSHGPSGSQRYQKKFVPKSDTNSSPSPSSRDHSVSIALEPHTTLTASLRASSSSPAAALPPGSSRAVRAGAGGGEGFVSYLPQDEAVASGLGADAGGLDAVESQRVVDLLNDELSELLKMGPRDFWREVAGNDSLHEFLDSYLQFRHRWYDFPHRGARGTVAGVIVGELELCRRVFMVHYRMSSNKDPEASANDCLSMKQHTALLQEKKLLDLPKLLDICAIYGHDNGELTSLLVTNAIKAQPNLLDNIGAVVSHFLNIAHTMHQRCCSSIEVLISSGGHEKHGYDPLHKDLLEVMDFINDAIVTLDAFADAYKPAALYFEMSHGNEELLRTLARLHDSLLPSLHQGFSFVSTSSAMADGTRNLSGGMLPDIVLSLKMLSMRIVKFGWKLLDFCYLNDQLAKDDLLQTATKMFPATVEVPAIRGDILVQTFKEISGEVSYNLQESYDGRTFLQNLEKEFKLLERIGSLRSYGWIFMDEEQYQYLSQIATSPSVKSWEKGLGIPRPSVNDNVKMDEEAIIMESKISQIKDLFPDYGKGFLSACLEVYNQNPEEVIQRILEGTLHEDLLSLDQSLEQIPQPKSAPQSRSDKGKGLLLESGHQTAALPIKVDPEMLGPKGNGPSSSSLYSLYGRYTRKSNNDLPDSAILDSRTAKDAVRTAVLVAEYEYEDEYDDSFDDLGLSVVESGFEETENLNDRIYSSTGKSVGPEAEFSSHNSSSKWSSQRKPQFYVKDGKNYSYKVSGSVGVSSAQEAAVVNKAQKETIYGLGRGGNLPLGAVKTLMDAEEQDQPVSDTATNLGRGNSSSRGRGGRRGGGNHYRKDRAMKKHFSGLGGY